MANIIIAYHSGFGHTKVVAEEVLAGVKASGAKVELLAVDTIDDGGWAKLDAADGIIFGSPTYMGSVSAPFKAFMDASSKPWFAQKWKDKIAAGFTNAGGLGCDSSQTILAFVTLASQHGMLWVSSGLFPSVLNGDGKGLNRLGSWTGLMTQSSNDSPEVTPPAEDRATARAFGERVGKATMQWVKGK